jgi:hypothetical protein
MFKKAYTTFDYIENILEIQQGIIYSGQKKDRIFSNNCIDRRYKKILDRRDVLKWKINWSASKEANYLDNSTKQGTVKEYERQIDQMVYKLYGLTPKEIEIIEGNKK